MRRWAQGTCGWLVGISLCGALGCTHASRALSSETSDAPSVTNSAPDTPLAAHAVAAPAMCGDPGDVLLFASPEHPVHGERLRVVAVTEHSVDAQLQVSLAPGAPMQTTERHGGPPYYWLTTVDAAAAGSWHMTLSRDAACGGGEIASKDLSVGMHSGPIPGTPRTALWFTRAAWTPSYENLYSAWIEHMFDAPLDAQPSWPALHEVLRDPARNFLFDHWGAGEDEQGVTVRPDCADLPYFLRAYFASKFGLPFGWSHCSRGDSSSPPSCTDFASSSDPFPPVDDKPQTLPKWADPARERTGPWETNAKRLGEFFHTTLADAVQSGAGRTPAADETSDYYPVALSIEALRPGTIFADPYGHVLVIAKRVAQTPTSGGILFAVDGQPDGTVARKRFWRGNFLFAIDPALGSAGFKKFRPVLRDRNTGKFRHLGNSELPDYSTEQDEAGVEGFYDKMDDVLSPAPLDPMQALLETIDALQEQVKTRAQSVDNGRKFLSSAKGAADMPDGAKIFETTGSWEDFSTPSRDLRLLIAIDVARSVPARVARRPSRYAMPAGKAVDQVKAELDARLATELRDRKFKYVRSDGSEWELGLQDVVDRQDALEMAYNPNECVEARWGAPAGSDELSTCSAHPPSAQVAKMASYREWFHERRRPPR